MAYWICPVFITLIYLSMLGIVVNAKVTDYCGTTKFVSDRGGSIKFKGNSSSKKSCTYEINVRKGKRIVLDWGTFRVDGDMPKCFKSSVAVYIGCNSRKISEFCSRNTDSLPHAIYSIDNCMKMVFQSTSFSNEEFSATYRTYDASDPQSTSSCRSKRDLYAKSGVIFSPSWPLKQANNFFSYECEWEVKVPSNYVIKMNFMDVDLYKSSFYCQSSLNRLRLKGEKSVLTSYDSKEYYCGTKYPFSKTTRYYQVELEYKFQRVGSRRGFVVGYIAYKTKETEKAAESQTRLAYIGLGIAIVVVVSCCIFFAWKRRRRSQERGRAAYHPPPTQEPHAAIATQPKGPDYGTGPPSGAPPPYCATMAQPPFQGYPAQAYPPSSFASAAPYPINTGPHQSSGAPYPPPSAFSEPYPGSVTHPGVTAATAAPPYQGDASYQASAPYPVSQPPYPTDAGGQAPYPTK